MGLFRRKEEKRYLDLLERLDGRPIKYCTERDVVTSVESVLGKQGAINVVDSELVIVCDAKEVFRCDIQTMRAGELLSLAGVTVTGFDSVLGKERTIVAYYQYYR